MSIIRAVKSIIFLLGGGTEPTYRVYYPFDRSACIKHYEETRDLPEGFSWERSFWCRRDAKAYVSFDCHGMPWGKTDEMFMGDNLQYYYPSVMFAQGKYLIREKFGSRDPSFTPIYYNNYFDLSKECCPPDWFEDVSLIEGAPG